MVGAKVRKKGRSPEEISPEEGSPEGKSPKEYQFLDTIQSRYIV